MSQKRFEDCYSKRQQRNFSIDEVQSCYENNPYSISAFRGDMWCPECRQAELSFTHQTSKKRAYFSALQIESHLENCSYRYDYIKNEDLRFYITNLNEQQIADKLDAMRNRLLVELQHQGNQINQNQIINNPLLVEAITRNRKRTHYSIRTKSLNTFIDKEKLGDDVFIFYGKNVQLNIKEKPYKPEDSEDEIVLYFLEVYTKSKNGEYKYKTEIYLGTRYQEITPYAIYNLIAIGLLNQKFSRLQIKLLKPSALLLELVD